MPTAPIPTRPRSRDHTNVNPGTHDSEGKEKTAASEELKVDFDIYFERLPLNGKRGAGTIAENYRCQEGLHRQD